MNLKIEKRDEDDIFNVKFSNLTDLYDYLKSDPKVNSKIFRELASLDKDYNFHGKPLETSIEYLINGYKDGLDNFLLMANILSEANIDTTDTRKLERGLYGGMPLAPLVAAGVPDCMLRYERDSKETVRNIFYTLSYPAFTDYTQIRNRGLITLYIIDSLEKKGEIINFRASEVSECGNEILNIEIGLKKPGDIMLDIEKCYFPMVSREFLRRILFRVKECTPLECNWGHGYGRAVSDESVRQLFDIPDKDIVIPTPSEMGIRGNNIFDDTITSIQYLKLEDEFDIDKIKTLKKIHKNKR